MKYSTGSLVVLFLLFAIMVSEYAALNYSDAPVYIGNALRQTKQSHGSNALALYWYKMAADRGSPLAQRKLGDLYRVQPGAALRPDKDVSLGIGQSDALALEWYGKAAQQNDIVGEARYGNLLMQQAQRNPLAKPADFQESLRWLHMAAEKNNSQAQDDIGWQYFYAQGVPQDTQEAIRWWKLSASNGGHAAQCHLGMMYAKGSREPGFDSVDADEAQSYLYLTLCAPPSPGPAHDAFLSAAVDLPAAQVATLKKQAGDMAATAKKDADAENF